MIYLQAARSTYLESRNAVLGLLEKSLHTSYSRASQSSDWGPWTPGELSSVVSQRQLVRRHGTFYRYFDTPRHDQRLPGLTVFTYTSHSIIAREEGKAILRLAVNWAVMMTW